MRNLACGSGSGGPDRVSPVQDSDIPASGCARWAWYGRESGLCPQLRMSVPDCKAWMPRSCCLSDMRAASTSYLRDGIRGGAGTDGVRGRPVTGGTCRAHPGGRRGRGAQPGVPGGGEGHLVQVAIAHEADEDAAGVVIPGEDPGDHGCTSMLGSWLAWFGFSGLLVLLGLPVLLALSHLALSDLARERPGGRSRHRGNAGKRESAPGRSPDSGSGSLAAAAGFALSLASAGGCSALSGGWSSAEGRLPGAGGTASSSRAGAGFCGAGGAGGAGRGGAGAAWPGPAAWLGAGAWPGAEAWLAGRRRRGWDRVVAPLPYTGRRGLAARGERGRGTRHVSGTGLGGTAW